MGPFEAWMLTTITCTLMFWAAKGRDLAALVIGLLVYGIGFAIMFFVVIPQM